MGVVPRESHVNAERSHATVETQKKDKYIGKQIEDEAIKTIYNYENKKTRYGRGTGIINKKY